VSSQPIPSPPQDASSTARGVVSTGAQTFAGLKTLQDGLKTNAIDSATAASLVMRGSMADGASAVAVKLGSSVAYANAAAKLLSVENNGTPKFTVGADGKTTITGLADLAVALSIPDRNGIGLGSENCRSQDSVPAFFFNGFYGFTDYGGNFLLYVGGFSASAQSARVDINQAQASQDTSVFAARTMSAGNTAVRVGSSVADGSVNALAKILMVGTGISGTNDAGTEKLSVLGNGLISHRTTQFTDDSGTAGNRTVNKVRGINKFTAGTATITITNDRCVADSQVDAVLQTNDATAVIKNVVPAAGSFTINLTANCTGATKVAWTIRD